MTFRLCTHTSQVCRCNDVEMQPCLAAVIAEYLDTLHWAVLTNGEDGGPGDESSVWCAHRDVRTITHSTNSFVTLKRWLEAHGIGLLQLPSPTTRGGQHGQ